MQEVFIVEVLFKVRNREHFFMKGRYEGSCLNDLEEYRGRFDGEIFWYEGDPFPSVTFEETGYPGEKVYRITKVVEYRTISLGDPVSIK